jgi:flagella basal body P-ring formation protein FlgA
VLLALAVAGPQTLLVHAAPTPAMTSVRSIETAAEQAVRVRAGENARELSLGLVPLDPRLRLAACDQPLEAFITGDGEVRHQTTVGVRCAGSIRWTIYTSVTVESLARVLVSRYALPRDAMLTAADFDLQTRRVPGMSNAFLSDASSLAGQRLLIPVGAGQPLSRDALAPAPLIRRGQQVTIVAGGGGIEVRMAGVALADGRISDHIRVQNLSSQRVIEAVVRSDGVVAAPL